MTFGAILQIYTFLSSLIKLSEEVRKDKLMVLFFFKVTVLMATVTKLEEKCLCLILICGS